MQADYDDDLKLQILINLCEQLFDMTIFLYATGPLTEVSQCQVRANGFCGSYKISVKQ